MIASWSFEPWFKREGVTWEHTSEMLASARAAIELINKNYSQPTMYVDSYGKHILEQLAPFAKFEVVYDDLYANNMSPKLWAMSKVLSYARQRDTFMHFDLDFLCWKKWPDSVFDCDIMFQSYEELLGYKDAVKDYYNLPEVKQYYNLPEVMDHEEPNNIMGVNLGIYYCRNMDFNKRYTDMALKLVEDHLPLFGTKKGLDMCVIEQHTLGMMIHADPTLKVNTIRKTGWDHPMYDEYFMHFVGQNYKGPRYEGAQILRKKFLGPWINDTVKKLSNEIQNERVRRERQANSNMEL